MMADTGYFDKRAFAVHDISSYDPTKGPPENAMDYLRSVVQESQKFAKVMVMEAPPPSTKRVNVLDQFAALLKPEKACPPPPQEYLPTAEWQDDFLASFLEKRKELLGNKFQDKALGTGLAEFSHIDVMSVLRAAADDMQDDEYDENDDEYGEDDYEYEEEYEGEGYAEEYGEYQYEAEAGAYPETQQAPNTEYTEYAQTYETEYAQYETEQAHYPQATIDVGEYDFETPDLYQGSSSLHSRQQPSDTLIASHVPQNARTKYFKRSKEHYYVDPDRSNQQGDDFDFDKMLAACSAPQHPAGTSSRKRRRDIESSDQAQQTQPKAKKPKKNKKKRSTKKKKAQLAAKALLDEEAAPVLGAAVPIITEEDTVMTEDANLVAGGIETQTEATTPVVTEDVPVPIVLQTETTPAPVETPTVLVPPSEDVQTPIQIEAPIQTQPEAVIPTVTEEAPVSIVKEAAPQTEAAPAPITEEAPVPIQIDEEVQFHATTDSIIPTEAPIQTFPAEEIPAQADPAPITIPTEETAAQPDASDDPDATSTDGASTSRPSSGEPKAIKLPHPRDDQTWQNLILSTFEPNIDILKALDPLMVLTIISILVRMIKEKDQNISLQHLNWLSGVLLKLEEPVLRETACDLKELLRMSCVARSKLLTVEDPMLPMLNGVILVITKYFGQIEF